MCACLKDAGLGSSSCNGGYAWSAEVRSTSRSSGRVFLEGGLHVVHVFMNIKLIM